MVLHLKMRESKSLRGLPSALCETTSFSLRIPCLAAHFFCTIVQVDAGWSSPVARQAHNLKVTGSNPVPATKHIYKIKFSNVERLAYLYALALYLNTTSTFGMPPLKNGGLLHVGGNCTSDLQKIGNRPARLPCRG